MTKIRRNDHEKNDGSHLAVCYRAFLRSFGHNTNSPNKTTESAETITTEAPGGTEPDLFTNIRESKETWIAYSLSAYENCQEPENLKEFFTDGGNMTYLTLYEHMFTFDRERSIPVAEALLAFICDEYSVDALLDMGKRCEYKTAYLQSLGLDVEYS